MRENQVHWHERNMASARVHQNVILVLYYIRCVTDLAGMHRFAFQHHYLGRHSIAWQDNVYLSS